MGVVDDSLNVVVAHSSCRSFGILSSSVVKWWLVLEYKDFHVVCRHHRACLKEMRRKKERCIKIVRPAHDDRSKIKRKKNKPAQEEKQTNQQQISVIQCRPR